ncbi:MAG: trigger factor [Aggregatilineales bacterium]
MNIQTERLENHTVRFTVEVGAERLEQAMRSSAARLARRVNIPGFRKGKAPYKVLVSYLGEGPILEDAVENLGNEVYKDALKQSDFDTYGPGSLDKFELEPQPTFTFVVPLAPTVDLRDYRSVRLAYQPPVVEDEAVNRSLKALRNQRALIEESRQPVAAGNQVHVKVLATLQPENGAEPSNEAQGEVSADKILINRDNIVVRLTDESEIAPGFTQALLGMTVGERRDFELTFPDDAEKYPGMHGRRVKFDVTVNKIETVTLPELTDNFAARVTETEDRPLTLLELRMRIREQLQASADDKAKAGYATAVLEKIVEQAQVSYPEALVEDQIDHMLQNLDSDLRKRGLTLQDYIRISGKTVEELRADQRESAEKSIKRSLVLHELERAEQIVVTDEDLDAEIERIVAQFGDRASALRGMYKRREMRENLRNELVSRKLMDRIVEIGRGQAPDLPPVGVENTDTPSEQAAESTTD